MAKQRCAWSALGGDRSERYVSDGRFVPSLALKRADLSFQNFLGPLSELADTGHLGFFLTMNVYIHIHITHFDLTSCFGLSTEVSLVLVDYPV